MNFTYGDRVMTKDGPGMIVQKDICMDYKPEKTKVWTGRWGVFHDVYPHERPKNFYPDDVLYYWPDELEMIHEPTGLQRTETTDSERCD